MQNYSVTFNTEVEHANFDIEAETPEAALAAARNMLDQAREQLWFQAYDWSPDVNEIVVENQDGDCVALWRDDDLCLRLAASNLLEAARNVIANWEKGDLAQAVRRLADAVALAQPRLKGDAHE